MAFAKKLENPPLTGDTLENTSRGVLVVMPPFFGPPEPVRPEGVSETAWTAALQKRRRARGLITSPQIDRGEAVRRALGWLERAGFPVRSEARRFALFVWPREWKGPHHGPQQIPRLVEDSREFVAELDRRRPALVVFLSCVLLDAMNDEQLLPLLEESAGRPVSPLQRLVSTRLRALTQRWSRTTVIALPIPGPNTTEAFEAELEAGLRNFFHAAGLS